MPLDVSSSHNFLCGASLFACEKKDRGLRPIAIREVLRRLTSKYVAHAVQYMKRSVFSPLSRFELESLLAARPLFTLWLHF